MHSGGRNRAELPSESGDLADTLGGSLRPLGLAVPGATSAATSAVADPKTATDSTLDLLNSFVPALVRQIEGRGALADGQPEGQTRFWAHIRELNPSVVRACLNPEVHGTLFQVLGGIKEFLEGAEETGVVQGGSTYDRLLIHKLCEFLGVTSTPGPKRSEAVALSVERSGLDMGLIGAKVAQVERLAAYAVNPSSMAPKTAQPAAVTRDVGPRGHRPAVKGPLRTQNDGAAFPPVPSPAVAFASSSTPGHWLAGRAPASRGPPPTSLTGSTGLTGLGHASDPRWQPHWRPAADSSLPSPGLQTLSQAAQLPAPTLAGLYASGDMTAAGDPYNRSLEALARLQALQAWSAATAHAAQASTGAPGRTALTPQALATWPWAPIAPTYAYPSAALGLISSSLEPSYPYSLASLAAATPPPLTGYGYGAMADAARIGPPAFAPFASQQPLTAASLSLSGLRLSTLGTLEDPGLSFNMMEGPAAYWGQIQAAGAPVLGGGSAALDPPQLPAAFPPGLLAPFLSGPLGAPQVPLDMGSVPAFTRPTGLAHQGEGPGGAAGPSMAPRLVSHQPPTQGAGPGLRNKTAGRAADKGKGRGNRGRS